MSFLFPWFIFFFSCRLVVCSLFKNIKFWFHFVIFESIRFEIVFPCTCVILILDDVILKAVYLMVTVGTWNKNFKCYILVSEHLSRLHMILKPFMLRRIKKDVENELSDKIEIMVYCPLTTRQKLLYSGMY